MKKEYAYAYAYEAMRTLSKTKFTLQMTWLDQEQALQGMHTCHTKCSSYHVGAHDSAHVDPCYTL